LPPPSFSCRRKIDPDSEETRRILDLGGRYLAVKREWIMNGTEIADVAIIPHTD
jgi:hypothetical protein